MKVADSAGDALILCGCREMAASGAMGRVATKISFFRSVEEGTAG